MTTEAQYHILKHLDQNPEASQRALAIALGVSLGKVNYCFKALADKGWVKVGNLKRSDRKFKYVYLLTPKGMDAKLKLTAESLHQKQIEFEKLKFEIASLKREINSRDVNEISKGKP
jgi:MarR family transcriptional regulator, temperature-dependent positive regulator of motility